MKGLLLLSLVGLILGLIGTILLAVSLEITKIKDYGGMTIKFAGMPATVTEINKIRFLAGLGLIALGFLLQALSIIIQLKIQPQTLNIPYF
ncbi:hypothetical protein A3K73_03630 [Candidatus Pacearchaeota archaeon RBG_13_36_9]|nr:MAG: hypothetical protein A3K73_03630 [Candidatus Pacearchaeota archaeon RBG_13_36_9]